MQDAISVLLLTLSPQNILHDHAAGSSRAKSPFYILRWLETLMHHCYWQDGQFYCSERNSRSHNESAIISSPTATLSIIAGLYPGFRLHNALGRAAYLDEALKKICATYDVLSKFLSIRIPGSDNRLDSATVIIGTVRCFLLIFKGRDTNLLKINLQRIFLDLFEG